MPNTNQPLTTYTHTYTPRMHTPKHNICGHSKSAVRLCLLVVLSEAMPLKSHQHDHLNVNQTRMIPMTMPMYTEKNP